MKKHLCFTGFLLLFFMSKMTFAQPTITNQNMIDIGATAPVQFFQQTNFDPGPAGENQIWDMSSLPSNGQPIDWQALDPASTTWSSDFPSATHAFHFPQDSTEGTLYYHYNGQELFLLGTVNTLTTSSFQDTLIYNFHDDPQLEVFYPINYQDTRKDTATGTAAIEFGGMGIVVDRTIFRTIKADAYGDLTTPYGSFSNVLRVLIEEQVEDRTFGQVVTRQENRRYYWYSAAEKYVLLQMDSLAVIPVAGPTSVSFSMFYRSGEVSTDLDKNIASDIGLSLFPNPATDRIRLRFEQNGFTAAQISILDLHGKRLLYMQSRQNDLSLSTADIPTGTYLLQIETSQGIASKLLIIK